jgi:hypothetical protein
MDSISLLSGHPIRRLLMCLLAGGDPVGLAGVQEPGQGGHFDAAQALSN